MPRTSTVIAFPSPNIKPWDREVHRVTLEQFILADSMGEWRERVSQDGFIVLQFPRVAMVCSPMGECLAIAYKGTDISVYFEEPVEPEAIPA